MNYDMGEPAALPAGGESGCQRIEPSKAIFRWKGPDGAWHVGHSLLMVGNRYLMVDVHGVWSVPTHLVLLQAERSVYEDQNGQPTGELTCEVNRQITPGNWSVGKGACVVTDQCYDDDEADCYGGKLICESVFNPVDAKLIAAAPTLLSLVVGLVNGTSTCQQVSETLQSLLDGKQRKAAAEPSAIEFLPGSREYEFRFAGPPVAAPNAASFAVRIRYDELERLLVDSQKAMEARRYGLMSLLYEVEGGKIVGIAAGDDIPY